MKQKESLLKHFKIGDTKLNLGSVKSSQGKTSNQFRAMIGFASKHQYVSIATYVTIFGHDRNEEKLKKRALNKGVHLFVVDFFPQNKRK